MNKLCISLLLLITCCLQGTAQKAGMQSFSMVHGETTVYDVYFKWGFLTRAGDAVFTYKADHSVPDATSRYQMLFKSTKFFDAFFKMRDTLSTYYDKDKQLIYSEKFSDEGNYYTIDLMKFNKGERNTSIHSIRYTPSGKRIDTVLIAAGEVTDLLGAIYFLRGVNRKMLKNGDAFPFTAAIGKDLVNVKYIYQNQQIVEHGNQKYSTLYFKIDILDEAFESTKTSAEVWVGDDDNFLPIKVRSKLKIGYVEVYHKNSTSLAHPLSCCIPIKR